MIKAFQERDASERLEVANNRFLATANIDVFKHSHKLAEIATGKAHKKKSLLEEILARPSQHGSSNRPIIVVPGTYYTGNVCLSNLVPLLADGRYVDLNQDKSAKDSFDSKQAFVRKIGSEDVKFEVFDTVHGFTNKEWRRVVCIFTNGEYFQMKDWPPQEHDRPLSDAERQQKLVNLFHRVKGFYLHYQDMVEPPQVKTWNVTRLVIQRNKRHQDINIQNIIWKELEAFLRKERFKDCGF